MAQLVRDGEPDSLFRLLFIIQDKVAAARPADAQRILDEQVVLNPYTVAVFAERHKYDGQGAGLFCREKDIDGKCVYTEFIQDLLGQEIGAVMSDHS